MKSGPCLPQLEKALAQKRRPNIAINQSINQSILKKKKNFTWLSSLSHRLCLVSESVHNQEAIPLSPKIPFCCVLWLLDLFSFAHHCLSCQYSPSRKGIVFQAQRLDGLLELIELKCWCRISQFFGMCVLAAQIERKPVEGKSSRFFLSLSSSRRVTTSGHVCWWGYLVLAPKVSLPTENAGTANSLSEADLTVCSLR